MYEEAGGAGIFLEDQVWPKKCGHMAGKRVVPREDWLARLRAAMDSRTQLFVTARTDARAAVGRRPPRRAGVRRLHPVVGLDRHYELERRYSADEQR